MDEHSGEKRQHNGQMVLLCGLLTGIFLGVSSLASSATVARKISPYHPVSVPERARTYYQAVWGIDNLLVRQTASGNLIRFSYRVIDAKRAATLVDKASQPMLLDQRSHVVLQIPVMDKVGPLRQTNDLSVGKEYWMAFSNKGNLVKPGDRVNVNVGRFHADGLVVE